MSLFVTLYPCLLLSFYLFIYFIIYLFVFLSHSSFTELMCVIYMKGRGLHIIVFVVVSPFFIPLILSIVVRARSVVR